MTLSPREREVVALLGDGSYRKYKEVAKTLGIAVSTLETHVTRILDRHPSPDSKRPRSRLQDLYRNLSA